MGILQQEYRSELPLPPPGDLPNPGIEPRSLTLQADSLPADPQRKQRLEGQQGGQKRERRDLGR